MITITFNEITGEYNIFDGSIKVATFKESELQLVASYYEISWPRVISPDYHEIKHIEELVL